MIDELTNNIDNEIKILREISTYMRRMEYADGGEKKLLEDTVFALKNSIRLINKSIPGLLREISLMKKLPSTSRGKVSPEKRLEKIKLRREGSEVEVILERSDKNKFLKELSISEVLIKKMKKRSAEEKEVYQEFKGARGYLKLSNRFFLGTAQNMIAKGNFKHLSTELKKANIEILFSTYVAMILLSTLMGFIFSIFLVVFLLFFDIGLAWPIFSLRTEDYLIRLVQVIWIPVVLPILVFAITYYYPSSEKKSAANSIDRELPFAVIHMSAISGSGIEPSEIFRIIGLNREYPALRKEIRKILNQINLYGYDLVTALNNASKSSPSEKLSELFLGLSTSITSGADLKPFFEKRAESLLVSYRLDREQYTKTAETFMDIYISVVIAAPMLLLLLLIMISISGIETGFSPTQIGFIVVAIVALINVFFLWFLQLKQPVY